MPSGRDFELLFTQGETPALVVAPDDDAEILAVTDAYLTATERDRDAILGRSLFEVVAADPEDVRFSDEAELRASLERARSTGEPDAVAPAPELGRPGEDLDATHARVWTREHVPFFDESGELEFFLHRVKDVTELVRLRRDLRRLEAAKLASKGWRSRLLRLFDYAPAILFATRGPDHVFEIVTPAGARAVGSWRQLLGLSVRQSLVELAEQEVVRLMDRAYQTAEAQIVRELLVRLDLQGDGHLQDLWFSCVFAPRFDPDGRVEGLDGLAFDVTAQVQARARLETANAELEAIFASLPDALYVGDLNGIWRANAPALDMLGYESMAELGRNIGTLASEIQTRRADTGEPIPPEAQPFARALSGQPAVQEVRVRHLKTGAERVLRSSCAPIRVGGEVVGAVAINTDISELKEAERALRDRIDFERQLIGIVSHDLRNPLGAIVLGVASLLRRGDHDPNTLRVLLRIKGSVERASRMVNDLLDFTQARLGGGIPVKPELADFRQITRHAVEDLRTTHPDREVSVRHEGDVSGHWDPDRLAQVVANLVSNALKYSPPDSPVTIVARGEDGSVVLEVHNQGPPIPADTVTRLFEPLQRGAGEGRGEGEGRPEGRSVGLGLYIVDHLVRAHGGTIGVQSRDGEGTTFVVRLPRRH